MCKPPPEAPVHVKVRMSLRATWYGLTLVYIAVVLTAILLAYLLRLEIR